MIKGYKSIWFRKLQDSEEAAMREIQLRVAELDELLVAHMEDGHCLSHARARLAEASSWAALGLLERTGLPRAEYRGAGKPPKA